MAHPGLIFVQPCHGFQEDKQFTLLIMIRFIVSSEDDLSTLPQRLIRDIIYQ